VIDGPHAGQTGWMLAYGAVAQDGGKPVEMFDKAVICKSK
jgi:hypothetical protein